MGVEHQQSNGELSHPSPREHLQQRLDRLLLGAWGVMDAKMSPTLNQGGSR
eukprot:CAMPEP_0194778054 /NCGR_PEP_ID=MMETSP0323_2-20130528/67244_1 /TAXON_ID=2866 ORGANISM="Crypthecodinium cohnii, Strain Seligo" /NCGR_SAMPLE_ID=MMETSP0323_2 /ASSEMBLY_ACC=CAM_ASM_000346 /LENGTH=50 /DNA_ID=CAMNT_0039715087 /DNA_START=133 /DNA_END=282 /DNA_ORIENTATION=+